MCRVRCAIRLFARLRGNVRESIATDEYRSRHRHERKDHDDLADSKPSRAIGTSLRIAGDRGIPTNSHRTIEFTYQVQDACVAGTHGSSGFEVPSIGCRVALHQGRSAGELEAAVVTNITQDIRLPDIRRYLQAKSRILEQIRPGGVIVEFRIREPVPSRSRLRVTCVRSESRRRHGPDSRRIVDGALPIGIHGKTVDCATRLIGRDVSNILAAAPYRTLKRRPKKSRGNRGISLRASRLEQGQCGQPFDVFVDCAHTDVRSTLSLESESLTGRQSASWSRWYDRTKRPKLGQAALLADIPVVTSDNPRTEAPEVIIDEILTGMCNAPAQPIVEVDRRRAIQRALGMARPGDCVMIAGKGHENEQIIGRERFPFDDRQVTREFLRERWQPLPHPTARASA